MTRKVLLIFFIIGIALILDYFGIRFCPFFNLFKIPCVGCGMTRAVKLILNGKIIESFKYNLLPIPLLILIIIYILLYCYDKNKMYKFIELHKKKIIIVFLIITLIVWIINLANPILY